MGLEQREREVLAGGLGFCGVPFRKLAEMNDKQISNLAEHWMEDMMFEEKLGVLDPSLKPILNAFKRVKKQRF